MKLHIVVLAALLSIGGPAVAGTTAVIHARAWTMTTDRALEDATIIIADGRIQSVSSAGAVPSGATIIDARGQVVTPGLVSGATQIGLMEVAGADDTADQSLSAGKLGAAFDVAATVDANSRTVEQARADGILWALVFPGASAVPPFSGQAAMLRLDLDGDVVERRGAAVFAKVGGSAAAAVGGSRAAQWTLLRSAISEARALKAGRRVDPEDRLFSRIDLEALLPVLGGNVPLAIQAQRESDIRQAIALARETSVRIVIVGGSEAWRVAPELAAAEISVVLDPSANLPSSYDELGSRLDNAAILARAGVLIGVVSATNIIDMVYNVGPASRTAAGLAVANGLPYAAALRALTLDAARIWGVADRTGSLERGKSADLVIWDGDPLEPASAPSAVIVGGVEVSLDTRETRLRDRYSPLRERQGWPSAY